MVYRIGFFSDTHLDYSSGSVFVDGVNVCAQDGYGALAETVDQILEHDVDIVIQI